MHVSGGGLPLDSTADHPTGAGGGQSLLRSYGARATQDALNSSVAWLSPPPAKGGVTAWGAESLAELTEGVLSHVSRDLQSYSVPTCCEVLCACLAPTHWNVQVRATTQCSLLPKRRPKSKEAAISCSTLPESPYVEEVVEAVCRARKSGRRCRAFAPGFLCVMSPYSYHSIRNVSTKTLLQEIRL